MPHVLLRCPRCRCTQPLPGDGRCRACGRSSHDSRWWRTTALYPIQPEEKNGNQCPECGDEVIVSLPPMGPSASPFASWLVIGIVGGPMLALAGGVWAAALIALAPAAVLLPFHLVYRKNRGPAAMVRIVVACRSCGYVRADLRDGDLPRWAWHQGQEFFNRTYRMLLPVTAFLLAVLVGASVIDTEAGWATSALFAGAVFFLVSVRWYRGVFGLRSWW